MSFGFYSSQTKYIIDLRHMSIMLGAKPCSSPLALGVKLSQINGDPCNDPTLYRHVVGTLQYCRLSRLDIAFVINRLCQFMHASLTTHWVAAERVLCAILKTT